MQSNKTIKFIDLFAGIGGFRLGFENACEKFKIKPKCVFTSEIKEHAKKVYTDNFPKSKVSGDITKISIEDIPDFDVLLAGFPCQAFSSAGKRHGFLDTRGTLFFEIERILKGKSPKTFILENVEGLINHDKLCKKDPMGRTLTIILEKLKQLDYKVTWTLLNAKNFGLAQSRKRIFIVGSKEKLVNLDNFTTTINKLKNILETGKPVLKTKLTKLLMTHYSLKDLYGKAVKDKRGGSDNIHSWDIELKGEVDDDQKLLLDMLLKARRSKKWGISKGIEWMDGMPLTLPEISTFYQHPQLQNMLEDLVSKNYLKYEHPKDIVEIIENGKKKKIRAYREDIEKGYNIVAGKLSYEISKILNPEDITPTLVATDLDRVVVPDKLGLRKLTLVEQCRLFGFPDCFKIDVKEREAHDLFGNTIAVPIVEAISEKIINQVFNKTTTKKRKQLALID